MASRTLNQKPLQAPASTQINNDADSWEFHYHNIVASLRGTIQEKEAIIRKRILRYFGQFKFDSQSYFSIRNNVDYEIEVLYGIDYMSIERARNYFQGFMANIRRMDDSHFLVEFRNKEECLAVINKLKIGGKDKFNSPHKLMELSDNGWVELTAYKEFVFQRKLMARYLTTLDKIDNICASTKKSFSYAYSEAKKRFMKSLKEDLNIEEERKTEREREIRRVNPRNTKQFQNYNCFKKERSREKNYGNFRNKERDFCNYKQISRAGDRLKSPSQVYVAHTPQQIQKQAELSDQRFDLYIKRRNEKKVMNPALATKDLNSMKSDQQVFNLQNCNIEPISKPSMTHTKQNLNDTDRDFASFLDKLNISGSKKDYSIFDVDEIEQRV